MRQRVQRKLGSLITYQVPPHGEVPVLQRRLPELSCASRGGPLQWGAVLGHKAKMHKAKMPETANRGCCKSRKKYVIQTTQENRVLSSSRVTDGLGKHAKNSWVKAQIAAK